MITFTIKYLLMNFIKNNKSYVIVLLIYLLINILFLVKYAVRQDFIETYFIVFTYMILVFGSFFSIKYFKKFINSYKKFNTFFITSALFVFFVFIVVNLLVDGNTLNTDRWSALEVTIKSILNLEYPYNVKDHLGKTTSNLPALFYIGLPFYLIGNIGFLQPIVFGLLILLIYKLKYSNSQKLLFLTLLLFSPAYLWEVFCKSDLMSNVFLLLVFMQLWHNKDKEDYFKKPYLLSLIIAFFVLTRAVVIIPLTIFLFKRFLKTSNIKKLKFGLGFVISVFLIFFPIILTIPDLPTALEHNPFNHQTRVGPKVLQVSFLILPFIVSFWINSLQDVVKYSFIILSLLLFSTLVFYINKFGFSNAVIQSYFDISYLGMILPFLVFYLLSIKNNAAIKRG